MKQMTSEQKEGRLKFLKKRIEEFQNEVSRINGVVQNLNILIAVPSIDGSCQRDFVISLINLSQTFVNLGIRHQVNISVNQSIISYLRDNFANAALFDTDSKGRHFTHLLFLDSDIAFQTSDILTALNSQKEIVGLPCARKEINWQNVALAARNGIPAEGLAQVSGAHTVEALENAQDSQDSTLQEVKSIGTGVLLIKREVLEKMADANPSWAHRRNPVAVFEGQPSKRDYGYSFFQLGKCPETQLLLGEDVFFCREARKLGFKIFIIPTAVTGHVGRFRYVMNPPGLKFIESIEAASGNGAEKQ